jgi:hypothetical protein
MNYQKLDAALAVALKDIPEPEQPSLAVFIHTEPVSDPAVTSVLENLGISGISRGKDAFTATLSPNAIYQLSDQPWVKYLKLSQKLRLVNRKTGIASLGI